MKAIKILFLLVVIMLSRSLVAISPAAYNFPMKAIIIRTVWMDQYDVEMQMAHMVLQVRMNNHMKLFAFSRRWESLDIYMQGTGCSVSAYLLRMGYMSSTFLLYMSGGNLA